MVAQDRPADVDERRRAVEFTKCLEHGVVEINVAVSLPPFGSAFVTTPLGHRRCPQASVDFQDIAELHGRATERTLGIVPWWSLPWPQRREMQPAQTSQDRNALPTRAATLNTSTTTVYGCSFRSLALVERRLTRVQTERM